MEKKVYRNSNAELKKFILGGKEAAFRIDIEKSEKKMRDARSKTFIREHLEREKEILMLVDQK